MPTIKFIDLSRRTGQVNLVKLSNKQEPDSVIKEDPQINKKDLSYVKNEVRVRTEKA